MLLFPAANHSDMLKRKTRNCSGIICVNSRTLVSKDWISRYYYSIQFSITQSRQRKRERKFSLFNCFIKEPETDAEPKCCDKPPNQRHPACWPVEIPTDDPFYSNFGRRCMEFVRSATGLTEHCKLGLFPTTERRYNALYPQRKIKKEHDCLVCSISLSAPCRSLFAGTRQPTCSSCIE